MKFQWICKLEGGGHVPTCPLPGDATDYIKSCLSHASVSVSNESFHQCTLVTARRKICVYAYMYRCLRTYE